MMLIPFRGGEIYADGDDCLRVDINHRRKLAGMVGRLEGLELVQDGDNERTFRFHINQFEAVAELVKPHRRPKVTEERRRQLRVGMSAINQQFPITPPLNPRKASAEGLAYVQTPF